MNAKEPQPLPKGLRPAPPPPAPPKGRMTAARDEDEIVKFKAPANYFVLSKKQIEELENYIMGSKVVIDVEELVESIMRNSREK